MPLTIKLSSSVSAVLVHPDAGTVRINAADVPAVGLSKTILSPAGVAIGTMRRSSRFSPRVKAIAIDVPREWWIGRIPARDTEGVR